MQRLIVCSACNSDRVITDHESGEVICSKCGLVISDIIQESRAVGSACFTTDEIYNKSSNVGLPNSLARHDMGLSTIIGIPNRDTSGHVLEEAMRSRMQRLRTWDIRIKTSISNVGNLSDAFNQLHTSKDKLGLPDAIVEKTAYIYRKAQERGLVRGRTISATLAAATYIACREIGIPKTLREINNIKRKALAKSYRLLINKLDIKIPIIDPIRFIIKIANKASLNEKTKRKAIDVMFYLNKKEISAGKEPMGFTSLNLTSS
jgi:transcription initiation factor TFIIB